MEVIGLHGHWMDGEMEWEGESLCERTTSKPSTLFSENHYGPVVIQPFSEGCLLLVPVLRLDLLWN